MVTPRIGIIGAGMWGNVHMKTLQENGRAKITWVCDISTTASERAQATYKIENGTTDYRELLAAPDVDAIIITAPPYMHAPIAVATLEAGKHLLLEKPMAISEAQIDQILTTAAQHPELVILEGSARHARLNPKYRFVKDFIAGGRLGTIYHMSHHQLGQGTYIEYNPNAAWSMDRTLAGGGPLLDWGEYDLSFHLGILNDEPELTAIQAALARRHLRDMSTHISVADVEMHGYALLTFSNGMTYFYERGAGVHNESRNETRIYGTQGGLRLHYTAWEANRIDYYHADNTSHHEELVVDMSAHPAHDNIPFIDHFIDCLVGKAEPLMPVTLAAKHARILLQILNAAS